MGKSPRVSWPDWVGQPALDPQGVPIFPFRPPRLSPDRIIHSNERYGAVTLRGLFQRAVAQVLDRGAHKTEGGADGRWLRRRERDGEVGGLAGPTAGMVWVWQEKGGEERDHPPEMFPLSLLCSLHVMTEEANRKEGWRVGDWEVVAALWAEAGVGTVRRGTGRGGQRFFEIDWRRAVKRGGTSPAASRSTRPWVRDIGRGLRACGGCWGTSPPRRSAQPHRSGRGMAAGRTGTRCSCSRWPPAPSSACPGHN